MSPRKTRRGAKAESVNESLNDTITKKLFPEKQKRMKTRHQVRQTIIIDSDEDQPTELTSSKSKAVEETPSTKITRRKAAFDSSVDIPNSTLDVTKSTRRRTRRGKENANNTEIVALNENDETQKVPRRVSRLKAAAAVALPASPKSVKRRRRNAKLRTEDFTPESSPMTVNLTPHRTTKTPRKSPMNLGSPKTHTDTSFRLSKTPRKLTAVSQSPVPSETSIKSLTQDIPENNDKDLIVIKQESTDDSITKKKDRSSKSKSKSPEKSLFAPIRKLSKTPKIMLRTQMSLHLRRIDSPNISTNLAAVSKNLAQATTVSPKVQIQSPTVVLDMLPSFANVTPQTSSSNQRKTPITSNSSEKRSSLGGESPRRSKSNTKLRSSTSDSGTPLRPITSPRSNTRTGKLSEGKSIILSSSNTPVDIIEKKVDRAVVGPILSSTPRERIRRSLNLSPGLGTTPGVVNNLTNGIPLVSSTRLVSEGRTRHSFRIEDETNPLITDDESSSMSGDATGTQLNGTYELRKETTESVENEQEKLNDGTYELIEPKTPNLRRRSVKRPHDEVDLTVDEKSAKRPCRVRFASPDVNSRENKVFGNDIGKSRSATPGHQTRQKQIAKQLGNGHDDSTANNTSLNGTNSLNNLRNRSSSIPNVSLLKTPKSNIKRRSNSLSQVNARLIAKKAQELSVSRLSKPRLSIPTDKKSDVKTPSARKAPNFALIHEKKFAKMESLLDVKKRVEKRHVALTTHIPSKLPKPINKTVPSKSTVSPKITPGASVSGAYNRYGFKLRKNDAMKMISSKKPPTSGNTQSENRLYLKGIRTNRRFDLLMKARNINL